MATVKIGNPVGKKGGNRRDDVRKVQSLLNVYLAGIKATTLKVNGIADSTTLRAIESFQKGHMKMRSPDRNVSPGGITLKSLNDQARKAGGMAAKIGRFVGKGDSNQFDDVKAVQKLLNAYLDHARATRLTVSGAIDDETIKAIQTFQKHVVGLSNPDGNVDPGGRTLERLNDVADMPPGTRTKVKVVLTFDDGPHHGTSKNLTGQALDVLKKHKIKAAFFVQTHVAIRGGSIQGKKMIERMHKDGHLVAIHTGSTVDHATHTLRASQNKLDADLKAAKAYLKARGIAAKYVRPPEGKHNPKVLEIYRNQNLKMILWDIDSKDSARGIREKDIKAHLSLKIKHFVGKGSVVILFHEIDSDTRGKIETYVKALRQSAEAALGQLEFAKTRKEIADVFAKRKDGNKKK